jgi:hypothetical protein
MDYIKYLCCCFIENNHNKNIENVTNNICIIETPQIIVEEPNNRIKVTNENSNTIKVTNTTKNENANTTKNENENMIKVTNTTKNENSDTTKNENSDTNTIQNKEYDFNEDYDEVTSEDIEEYNDIEPDTKVRGETNTVSKSVDNSKRNMKNPFASSIKNYFNKD